MKATQKATAKFWPLGAKKREGIPHRDSLFFIFVRPESKELFARFEAFVVPSVHVYASAREPKPEENWVCSWSVEEGYKERWDTVGVTDTSNLDDKVDTASGIRPIGRGATAK